MTKMESVKPNGLAMLREPFPESAISKLPKPTKAQTQEVRNNFKAGMRCEQCGGWHHPNVVHLDYVGHAALTDRLLDCDPEWNWEPVATDESGTPAIDGNGGMWIRLTVCGVTRLGYGDADGKTGGNAVKERIGDALRNAAMRFGAALDLWHKGDLHADEEPAQPDQSNAVANSTAAFDAQVKKAIEDIGREPNLDSLGAFWKDLNQRERVVASSEKVIAAKNKRKSELEAPSAKVLDDEIPY